MAQTQGQRLRALRNDPNLGRFVVEGVTTGKQLGTGSYGAVEEIDVNGLICAGKKIHEVLLDADNEGIENVAMKYVQECQVMSGLRHPNIALFIGVCFLPDCQLPVLVMERLDSNVDDLIETVPNIPLVLKRSMLEDVARGLLYLHKHNPQIIHRDLTAKNVLLSTSIVAKVTDFGNSRLVNLQPGQLACTLSRLPGTLVYMPPESFEASCRYGPSLDVFSFGHLALFVMLQVFPGDLLQHTYADPHNPGRLCGRSEVGRRGKYFDQLEDLPLSGQLKHALVQLIQNCLGNDPSQRPSAEQLVSGLKEMKANIEGPYGELAKVDAVRQVMTVKTFQQRKKETADEVIAKDKEIQQLRQQLQTAEERYEVELQQKDVEIQQKAVAIQQKDGDMARLQEIHEAELQQLNTQLREKDQRLRQQNERHRLREEQLGVELQQKDSQLHLKDSELQQRIAEVSRLQGELQSMQRSLQNTTRPTGPGAELRSPGVQTPLSGLKLPLKLKWRRGKDMPRETWNYPQVVVFKGKVYIGGGGASSDRERQTVIVYDPRQETYDTLPQYSYMYFCMAVVNNQLVLVGGSDVRIRKKTNNLGVWNEKSKTWSHQLPPMTTACRSPSVATHNRWLIVIGGEGDGGTELSRVEILDTESRQWCHAAPLPQPCSNTSLTTIGDTCYLVGGFTTGAVASNKVFCINLHHFISEAVSQPASAIAPPTTSSWQTLPDTPLTCSTTLAINGALLAIGGVWPGSKDIYHYQPSSRSWIKVGELPTGRSLCGCTVLPSGEVFVAGGDVSGVGGVVGGKQVDIALLG